MPLETLAGGRLVAGIGCRRGAALSQVQAAIGAALTATGRTAREISMLATIAGKSHEPGLMAAALALGVPLRTVAAGGVPTPTQSAASLAATGLGSLAEACALAAAGPGARLLAPRSASAAATCALAESAA